MYAFRIQEYISGPWLNISCTNVFSPENTLVGIPAAPTMGENVWTILLYSSIASRLESLWPDAISSLMCRFLAINKGLVVCPSTNPSNSLARRVSCGSPPSTNIFVLGRVIEILGSGGEETGVYSMLTGCSRMSRLAELCEIGCQQCRNRSRSVITCSGIPKLAGSAESLSRRSPRTQGSRGTCITLHGKHRNI